MEEKEKKGYDVFKLTFPNLRGGEADYVRDELNKFTKELLNEIEARRINPNEN